MSIQLKHIGKSADDLRFFILRDGQHAGGITVHSVSMPQFSYGIAIAKSMRRKGVAHAALSLLFAHMRALGFTRVVVRIAPGNAASLALHAALGFAHTQTDPDALTWELDL